MASAIPQEFLIATREPGSVSKAKQTLPSEMYLVTGMTGEHGESTEEVELTTEAVSGQVTVLFPTTSSLKVSCTA